MRWNYLSSRCLAANCWHFSFLFFSFVTQATQSNETVTNNAVSVRSFSINVILQFKPNLALHPVSSRPGLLNASDPGYPWLADSWPATSLPVNSSSGGPNDLGNFGRGGENLGLNLPSFYMYSYKHYFWRSDLRVAPALAGASTGWVMGNSASWCHGTYFRARECRGRDRQRGGWLFGRMVPSSHSWRTGAAWLAQMRTLPLQLYIISPSLGVQNTDRWERELALSATHSLPLWFPLSGITHIDTLSIMSLRNEAVC